MIGATGSPLVILLALFVVAQTAGPARAEDIQPDRPELTESARLVPRGSYQLESGVAIAKEQRAGASRERIFAVETDLRIGLARDLELNLDGEPLVHVNGPMDDTGPGDIRLGFRYRFVEGFEDVFWPPSVAVKPTIKIPVASEPIGTGRWDVGVLLLASLELPWDFELEVNLGGAAIGQRSGGFIGQALGSASLSWDFSPRFYPFLELLLASREERNIRGQMGINAGLVYRLMPTLAVDAGVQTSLLGPGPDYVVRVGVSALFRR